MKKIILTLLLMTTSSFCTEHKVVFKLTSGDEERVANLLIANLHKMQTLYKERGDTLKSAVVISGRSYKFFRKDISTKLEASLKELSQSGTEFKICNAGIYKLDIDENSLVDYVVPEFSSKSSISEYEDLGYRYIEVR